MLMLDMYCTILQSVTSPTSRQRGQASQLWQVKTAVKSGLSSHTVCTIAADREKKSQVSYCAKSTNCLRWWIPWSGDLCRINKLFLNLFQALYPLGWCFHMTPLPGCCPPTGMNNSCGMTSEPEPLSTKPHTPKQPSKFQHACIHVHVCVLVEVRRDFREGSNTSSIMQTVSDLCTCTYSMLA